MVVVHAAKQMRVRVMLVIESCLQLCQGQAHAGALAQALAQRKPWTER